MTPGPVPRSISIQSTEQGTFVMDHVSPDIFMKFKLGGPEGKKGMVRARSSMKSYASSFQAIPRGQYSVTLTRYDSPALSVTVLDNNGKPVPGAIVNHHFQKPARGGGFLIHGTGGITDKFGLVDMKLHLFNSETPNSLNGQRQWLAALKEGLGTAYSVSSVSIDNLEVILRLDSNETIPIRVLVIDEDTGKPAEGLPISFEATPFFNWDLGKKLTNNRGEAVFTGIRNTDPVWGSVDLYPAIYKISVSPPWGRDVINKLTVGSTQLIEVKVKLKR